MDKPRTNKNLKNPQKRVVIEEYKKSLDFRGATGDVLDFTSDDSCRNKQFQKTHNIPRTHRLYSHYCKYKKINLKIEF